MKDQCKTHPRYQGKLQPRVKCLECWRVYYGAAYARMYAASAAKAKAWEEIGIGFDKIKELSPRF